MTPWGQRRDGAEPGAGMDVGGKLAFTDAVTGLSLVVPGDIETARKLWREYRRRKRPEG